MPDAAVLATILLVVGLFLVAVELMIPSFGLIGMSAAICLLVSAWSAYQAWWTSDPVFFWSYVAFLVAGIPTSLFGTLYLIQNTSLGGFVILRAPELPQDGPSPEMQSHLHSLVGEIGRTVSPLTPGGMVEVCGERHHAECVGPLIESRVSVEVVGTRATRLVVRRSTEKPAAAEPADSTPEPSRPAAHDVTVKPSGQLDFDIPENYTAG